MVWLDCEIDQLMVDRDSESKYNIKKHDETWNTTTVIRAMIFCSLS